MVVKSGWVRVRVRFAFCNLGFSFTEYIHHRVRVGYVDVTKRT